MKQDALKTRQYRGMLSWLSPDVAIYIYTVFLKPKWIRGLIQTAIRVFIPEHIRIHDVTLCLNRKDAIVSGALALGCYESHLLNQFVSLLKPGMCVVDIGANIGLYSVVSAHRVGLKGKIIAIEPDETNCSFIAKSVAANNFSNVIIHQIALSNTNGETPLYLCESNNADHRIYDASDGSTSIGRKSTIVRTSRLDDLISEDLYSKIDIIKMDIQGAEAMALEGMWTILSVNPNITLVMEYWPWGLKHAGSNPLKLLQDLRALGFLIFVFDAKSSSMIEVKDDYQLASKQLERQHANLFLTRKALSQ